MDRAAMLKVKTVLPVWIACVAMLEPIPGRAVDMGDVAVIQADPTIVEPGHPFLFVGQTLRFRPTSAGYSVESTPLDPEADKGVLTPALRAEPAEIDLGFDFPYFGRSYRKLYAYVPGIMSFERLRQLPIRPSPKSVIGQPPLLAALWSPAARHSPGTGPTDGIYANTDFSDRVVLTWYRVMPQKVESVVNTYQVVLSKDGSIRMSYREIGYPEGLVGLFAGDTTSRSIPVDLKNAGSVASAGGFYEQFRLPRTIPQKLAQSFYRDHADVFDALAVFETFQLGRQGFFLSVPVQYRDQVAGGQLVDRSREFGSQGRLGSYLELNQLSNYPQNTASAMLTRAYGYRTVQQIIQEQGSTGATAPTPRNLHLAFVLLVPPGTSPSSTEIAHLDAIRTSWERDFASYGLGVAMMDTRLDGPGLDSRAGGSTSAQATAPAQSQDGPASSDLSQQQAGSATVQDQAQATQIPSDAHAHASVTSAMIQQLKAALSQRVARLLGRGKEAAFGELDKKLDNWTGANPAPSGDIAGSSAGYPIGGGVQVQQDQAPATREAPVEQPPGTSPGSLPPEPGPDLAVAASDVQINPVHPRAGEQLEITVTVRNTGTGDAPDALVRCALLADGTVVAKKQFTIGVPAGSATPIVWSLPTPTGKTLVLSIAASAPQDTQLRNNKATVGVAQAK